MRRGGLGVRGPSAVEVGMTTEVQRESGSIAAACTPTCTPASGRESGARLHQAGSQAPYGPAFCDNHPSRPDVTTIHAGPLGLQWLHGGSSSGTAPSLTYELKHLWQDRAGQDK